MNMLHNYNTHLGFKILCVFVSIAFLFTTLDIASALSPPLNCMREGFDPAFHIKYCLKKTQELINYIETGHVMTEATLKEVAEWETLPSREITDLDFSMNEGEILINIANGLIFRYYDPLLKRSPPEGTVSASYWQMDRKFSDRLARELLYREEVLSEIASGKKESGEEDARRIEAVKALEREIERMRVAAASGTEEKFTNKEEPQKEEVQEGEHRFTSILRLAKGLFLILPLVFLTGCSGAEITNGALLSFAIVSLAVISWVIAYAMTPGKTPHKKYLPLRFEALEGRQMMSALTALENNIYSQASPVTASDMYDYEEQAPEPLTSQEEVSAPPYATIDLGEYAGEIDPGLNASFVDWIHSFLATQAETYHTDFKGTTWSVISVERGELGRIEKVSITMDRPIESERWWTETFHETYKQTWGIIFSIKDESFYSHSSGRIEYVEAMHDLEETTDYDTTDGKIDSVKYYTEYEARHITHYWQDSDVVKIERKTGWHLWRHLESMQEGEDIRTIEERGYGFVEIEHYASGNVSSVKNVGLQLGTIYTYYGDAYSDEAVYDVGIPFKQRGIELGAEDISGVMTQEAIDRIINLLKGHLPGAEWQLDSTAVYDPRLGSPLPVSVKLHASGRVKNIYFIATGGTGYESTRHYVEVTLRDENFYDNGDGNYAVDGSGRMVSYKCQCEDPFIFGKYGDGLVLEYWPGTDNVKKDMFLNPRDDCKLTLREHYPSGNLYSTVIDKYDGTTPKGEIYSDNAVFEEGTIASHGLGLGSLDVVSDGPLAYPVTVNIMETLLRWLPFAADDELVSLRIESFDRYPSGLIKSLQFTDGASRRLVYELEDNPYYDNHKFDSDPWSAGNREYFEFFGRIVKTRYYESGELKLEIDAQEYWPGTDKLKKEKEIRPGAGEVVEYSHRVSGRLLSKTVKDLDGNIIQKEGYTDEAVFNVLSIRERGLAESDPENIPVVSIDPGNYAGEIDPAFIGLAQKWIHALLKGWAEGSSWKITQVERDSRNNITGIRVIASDFMRGYDPEIYTPLGYTAIFHLADDAFYADDCGRIQSVHIDQQMQYTDFDDTKYERTHYFETEIKEYWAGTDVVRVEKYRTDVYYQGYIIYEHYQSGNIYSVRQVKPYGRGRPTAELFEYSSIYAVSDEPATDVEIPFRGKGVAIKAAEPAAVISQDLVDRLVDEWGSLYVTLEELDMDWEVIDVELYGSGRLHRLRLHPRDIYRPLPPHLSFIFEDESFYDTGITGVIRPDYGRIVNVYATVPSGTSMNNYTHAVTIKEYWPGTDTIKEEVEVVNPYYSAFMFKHYPSGNLYSCVQLGDERAENVTIKGMRYSDHALNLRGSARSYGQIYRTLSQEWGNNSPGAIQLPMMEEMMRWLPFAIAEDELEWLTLKCQQVIRSPSNRIREVIWKNIRGVNEGHELRYGFSDQEQIETIRYYVDGVMLADLEVTEYWPDTGKVKRELERDPVTGEVTEYEHYENERLKTKTVKSAGGEIISTEEYTDETVFDAFTVRERGFTVGEPPDVPSEDESLSQLIRHVFVETLQEARDLFPAHVSVEIPDLDSTGITMDFSRFNIDAVFPVRINGEDAFLKISFDSRTMGTTKMLFQASLDEETGVGLIKMQEEGTGRLQQHLVGKVKDIIEVNKGVIGHMEKTEAQDLIYEMWEELKAGNDLLRFSYSNIAHVGPFTVAGNVPDWVMFIATTALSELMRDIDPGVLERAYEFSREKVLRMIITNDTEIRNIPEFEGYYLPPSVLGVAWVGGKLKGLAAGRYWMPRELDYYLASQIRFDALGDIIRDLFHTVTHEATHLLHWTSFTKEALERSFEVAVDAVITRGLYARTYAASAWYEWVAEVVTSYVGGATITYENYPATRAQLVKYDEPSMAFLGEFFGYSLEDPTHPDLNPDLIEVDDIMTLLEVSFEEGNVRKDITFKIKEDELFMERPWDYPYSIESRYNPTCATLEVYVDDEYKDDWLVTSRRIDSATEGEGHELIITNGSERVRIFRGFLPGSDELTFAFEITGNEKRTNIFSIANDRLRTMTLGEILRDVFFAEYGQEAPPVDEEYQREAAAGYGILRDLTFIHSPAAGLNIIGRDVSSFYLDDDPNKTSAPFKILNKNAYGIVSEIPEAFRSYNNIYNGKKPKTFEELKKDYIKVLEQLRDSGVFNTLLGMVPGPILDGKAVTDPGKILEYLISREKKTYEDTMGADKPGALDEEETREDGPAEKESSPRETEKADTEAGETAETPQRVEKPAEKGEEAVPPDDAKVPVESEEEEVSAPEIGAGLALVMAATATRLEKTGNKKTQSPALKLVKLLLLVSPLVLFTGCSGAEIGDIDPLTFALLSSVAVFSGIFYYITRSKPSRDRLKTFTRKLIFEVLAGREMLSGIPVMSPADDESILNGAPAIIGVIDEDAYATQDILTLASAEERIRELTASFHSRISGVYPEISPDGENDPATAVGDDRAIYSDYIFENDLLWQETSPLAQESAASGARSETRPDFASLITYSRENEPTRFDISSLRSEDVLAYDHYESGHLNWVIFRSADENGNIYYKFDDEDFEGRGFGRILVEVRAEAEAQDGGAIAHAFVYYGGTDRLWGKSWNGSCDFTTDPANPELGGAIKVERYYASGAVYMRETCAPDGTADLFEIYEYWDSGRIYTHWVFHRSGHPATYMGGLCDLKVYQDEPFPFYADGHGRLYLAAVKDMADVMGMWTYHAYRYYDSSEDVKEDKHFYSTRWPWTDVHEFDREGFKIKTTRKYGEYDYYVENYYPGTDRVRDRTMKRVEMFSDVCDAKGPDGFVYYHFNEEGLEDVLVRPEAVDGAIAYSLEYDEHTGRLFRVTSYASCDYSDSAEPRLSDPVEVREWRLGEDGFYDLGLAAPVEKDFLLPNMIEDLPIMFIKKATGGEVEVVRRYDPDSVEMPRPKGILQVTLEDGTQRRIEYMFNLVPEHPVYLPYYEMYFFQPLDSDGLWYELGEYQGGYQLRIAYQIKDGLAVPKIMQRAMYGGPAVSGYSNQTFDLLQRTDGEREELAKALALEMLDLPLEHFNYYGDGLIKRAAPRGVELGEVCVLDEEGAEIPLRVNGIESVIEITRSDESIVFRDPSTGRTGKIKNNLTLVFPVSGETNIAKAFPETQDYCLKVFFSELLGVPSGEEVPETMTQNVYDCVLPHLKRLLPAECIPSVNTVTASSGHIDMPNNVVSFSIPLVINGREARMELKAGLLETYDFKEIKVFYDDTSGVRLGYYDTIAGFKDGQDQAVLRYDRLSAAKTRDFFDTVWRMLESGESLEEFSFDEPAITDDTILNRSGRLEDLVCMSGVRTVDEIFEVLRRQLALASGYEVDLESRNSYTSIYTYKIMRQLRYWEVIPFRENTSCKMYLHRPDGTLQLVTVRLGIPGDADYPDDMAAGLAETAVTEFTHEFFFDSQPSCTPGIHSPDTCPDSYCLKVKYRVEAERAVPVSITDGIRTIDLEGMPEEERDELFAGLVKEGVNPHIACFRNPFDLIVKGLEQAEDVTVNQDDLEAVLRGEWISSLRVTVDGEEGIVNLRQFQNRDKVVIVFSCEINDRTIEAEVTINRSGSKILVFPDGTTIDLYCMLPAEKNMFVESFMRQLLGVEVDMASRGVERLSYFFEEYLGKAGEIFAPDVSVNVAPISSPERVCRIDPEEGTISLVLPAEVNGERAYFEISIDMRTLDLEKAVFTTESDRATGVGFAKCLHMKWSWIPSACLFFYNSVNSYEALHLVGLRRGVCEADFGELSEMDTGQVHASAGEAWQKVKEEGDLLDYTYDIVRQVGPFTLAGMGLPPYLVDWAEISLRELMRDMDQEVMDRIYEFAENNQVRMILVNDWVMKGVPELRGYIFGNQILGIAYNAGKNVGVAVSRMYLPEKELDEYFNTGDEYYLVKDLLRISDVVAQFMYVIMHEATHVTHRTGLTPEQDQELYNVGYDAVVTRGLYSGAYMSTNYAEFFAEGTSALMGLAQPRGDDNYLYPFTRPELSGYDEQTAAFLASVFASSLREATYPDLRPEILKVEDIARLIDISLQEYAGGEDDIDIVIDEVEPRQNRGWGYRYEGFYLDTEDNETYGTLDVIVNGQILDKWRVSSRWVAEAAREGHELVVSSGSETVSIFQGFMRREGELVISFHIQGEETRSSIYPLGNDIERAASFGEALTRVLLSTIFTGRDPEEYVGPPVEPGDHGFSGATVRDPVMFEAAIDFLSEEALSKLRKSATEMDKLLGKRGQNITSGVFDTEPLKPAVPEVGTYLERFANKHLNKLFFLAAKEPGRLPGVWRIISPDAKAEIDSLIKKGFTCEVRQSLQGKESVISIRNGEGNEVACITVNNETGEVTRIDGEDVKGQGMPVKRALLNKQLERVIEAEKKCVGKAEVMDEEKRTGEKQGGEIIPDESEKVDTELREAAKEPQVEEAAPAEEAKKETKAHPAEIGKKYEALRDSVELLSISAIIAFALAEAALQAKKEKELPEEIVKATGKYIAENKKFIGSMIGENKRPILVRVPVKVFENPENRIALGWLCSLNNTPGSNIYLELYNMEKPDDVISENVYSDYSIARRDFTDERSKENVISIIGADRGITSAEYKKALQGTLQHSETLKNSVIVPMGLKDDPIGIIRSTFFGMRLIHIVRNGDDTEFITETIASYNKLIDPYNLKAKNLTPGDITALVTGEYNINDLVKTLIKIIEMLPMERLSLEEIRALKEQADLVSMAA